jgi:uncharacterized protein Veg
MEAGQAARVTKTNSYKDKESYKIATKNRQARIYALTDYVIIVEYIKDDKPTCRESFNLADMIEKRVNIEVKEGNGWKKVTKKYFKH